MARNIKITVLWLLTICGFACHSICDVLPIFWGRDVAMVGEDVAEQGMTVMMMTLSYLLPACSILCVMYAADSKPLRQTNAVLAMFITLFNMVHAFIELPSANAGQYVITPMMIAVGLLLTWHSIKYVKLE